MTSEILHVRLAFRDLSDNPDGEEEVGDLATGDLDESEDEDEDDKEDEEF